MTLLKVPVCALAVSLGVACGPQFTDPIGVEAETIELGSPVTLQQLQVTPDCYQAYTMPLTGASIDATIANRMAPVREMQALHTEYVLQFLQPLLEPVLADPTALQWDVQLGSRVVRGVTLAHIVVEGVTLARGEDWGRLLMTMKFTPPPEWQYGTQFTTQIDYDRDHTRLDGVFSSGDIVAAAEYFRYGNFARGCSSQSKVSFELGLWPVGDEVENRILCWAHDDFEWVETDEPHSSARSQQLQSSCNEAVHKYLFDGLDGDDEEWSNNLVVLE